MSGIPSAPGAMVPSLLGFDVSRAAGRHVKTAVTLLEEQVRMLSSHPVLSRNTLLGLYSFTSKAMPAHLFGRIGPIAFEYPGGMRADLAVAMKESFEAHEAGASELQRVDPNSPLHPPAHFFITSGASVGDGIETPLRVLMRTSGPRPVIFVIDNKLSDRPARMLLDTGADVRVATTRRPEALITAVEAFTWAVKQRASDATMSAPGVVPGFEKLEHRFAG